MRARFTADVRWVSETTRRAGGLNLLLLGVLDGAIGAALLDRDRLTAFLVDTLPEFVDEVALVANAPVVLALARWAPLIGVLLLCLGTLQMRGGWRAYHGRRWKRGVGLAAVGLVNPLTAPVALVAVTLLLLAREQFEP